MSDKVFIGRTKVIQTKFGNLTKISFGPKDFEKFNEIKKDGWVNLVLKSSQKNGEPYLEVDDFVPQKREENTPIQDSFGLDNAF